MKRLLAALVLLAVAASLYAQSTEQQLFLDAEGRFQNGNYELALEQYDAFLKAYPLSSYVPDVQFRRAVCFFRLGRTQAALDLFRQVEVRYPQTRFLPYVPFWIGLSEYQLKEWAAAAISFDVYLSGNDSSYRNDALLYKAVSDIQVERFSDARLALVELTNRVGDPASQPYALAELAWLQMRDRDYHAVLDLLSKVDLAKVPESFQSRLMLYKAEAYYDTGDTKAAQPLYSTLLSAQPDVASVAFQRLFSIYQASGDLTQMTGIVNRAEVALAGMPKILAEFWLRVGIADYNGGKLDLAESYLKRVWDLRPSLAVINPLVPLYLAEIYSRTERLGSAIEILKAALPGAPDYQDLILFRLAGYEMEAQKLQDAKASCDAFLKHYPNSKYSEEAAYLDAYLSFRIGDFAATVVAVDGLLASAKGGAYTARLLKLKALAEARLGHLAEAISAMNEYLPLAPSDLASRVDLIKIYFEAKDYPAVVSEVTKLEAADPSLRSQNLPDFLLLQYMRGLGQISQKEYANALASLRLITAPDLKSAGLTVIEPYLTFYEGWASYRLADYATAGRLFAEVISAGAPADLVQRSYYLAGWTSYLQGDYQKASGYFLEYAKASSGEEIQRGSYMAAKSLAGAKDYAAAASAFEGIFRGSPSSPFAVDALYEYAGVLANQGRIDQSVAAYTRLVTDYPSSPLAEAASFRTGEILYENKQYEAAKAAFTAYRLKFPNGGKLDAALYWGGMAAFRSGEDFGAVLLWNQLIGDYKSSSFRPDAMQRVAAIYEKRGDLQRALDLYNELLAAYPTEAKTAGAADQVQKIKYLLAGESSQEAELLVEIGKDGGAETAAGRTAMTNLARIYLYTGNGRIGQALPLLEAVVAKKSIDPASAARAQYYIGEYYERKGDLARAANEFLVASTIDTANRDLTAAAMYRAAEAASSAGNTSDAQELAARIERLFPGSEWAAAAKRMLGGAP